MMPSEDTKIFEFNQYHKFDKTHVLKSPATLLKRDPTQIYYLRRS